MKPEGNFPLAFHFTGGVDRLDKHEEILDLKTIESILNYIPNLKNSPFSNMDKDVLLEAYKVLEEFSEEIKPI